VSNKVLHRHPRHEAAPGRPRGDVRQALQRAALNLHASAGSANWRELAAHACVGYSTAKTTVQNMVRAGELEACGEEPAPHTRRPMKRYRPATVAASVGSRPGAGHEGLAQALKAWR
jgi:hypothetical protein